jgi:hypothetical protein
MRALKCSSRFLPSLADLRLMGHRKSVRPVAWGRPQTLRVGAPSVLVTSTAWVFIVLAMVLGPLAVVRGAQLGSVAWLVLGLMVSVALLVSAVGTLRRLDWARRGLIGLLLAAVGFNLVALLLLHQQVFAVMAHALVGGLLAWVVHGLMAAVVRQEFS